MKLVKHFINMLEEVFKSKSMLKLWWLMAILWFLILTECSFINYLNKLTGSDDSFKRVEAVFIWLSSSLALQLYHSIAYLPLPLKDFVLSAKTTWLWDFDLDLGPLEGIAQISMTPSMQSLGICTLAVVGFISTLSFLIRLLTVNMESLNAVSLAVKKIEIRFRKCSFFLIWISNITYSFTQHIWLIIHAIFLF